MRDQNEFMKQMLELVELAKANESRISKKEVDDFCSDLDLTKPQLKLVYDFLKEHNIDLTDGSKTDFSTSEGDGPTMNTEDSKYIRFYRKELREMREYSIEECDNLYARLLAGEEVQSTVVETYLHRVVTIANKYRNRGVPFEDLIGEANLELMLLVGDFCGNSDIKDLRKELDRGIRKRLIELVDGELDDKGKENSLLAKTNLIHEATKVLAEEWGRLATVEELAEYTKMTEEEIQMYVELALDEIHIAK